MSLVHVSDPETCSCNNNKTVRAALRAYLRVVCIDVMPYLRGAVIRHFSTFIFYCSDKAIILGERVRLMKRSSLFKTQGLWYFRKALFGLARCKSYNYCMV